MCYSIPLEVQYRQSSSERDPWNRDLRLKAYPIIPVDPWQDLRHLGWKRDYNPGMTSIFGPILIKFTTDPGVYVRGGIQLKPLI